MRRHVFMPGLKSPRFCGVCRGLASDQVHVTYRTRVDGRWSESSVATRESLEAALAAGDLVETR